MKDRVVITIDGLAASGKSTLAKLLAKELSYIHVNTGLLYRAVGLLALNENVPEGDIEALVRLVHNHKFSFQYSPQRGSSILIDGVDREDELHSTAVASFTSKIAAIASVREVLRPIQIKAFADSSVVVEGRDTGTIIFPNAQVKFFVEGDPFVRASRRAKDLEGSLGTAEIEMKVKVVAEQLRERDMRDADRDVAPLRKAQDSIVVDNSGDLQQTLQAMVSKVRERLVRPLQP